MTAEELKNILLETGITFDTDHPDHLSPEKNSGRIQTPFLEFEILDKGIPADGTIFLAIPEVTLRLYDDVSDGESQQTIENALIGADLRPVMGENSYDPNSGLYLTTYTFQM